MIAIGSGASLINCQKIPTLGNAPGIRERLIFHYAVYGASRLRPFSRRRRIIARPPGVDILTKKPCLRLRRNLLG